MKTLFKCARLLLLAVLAAGCVTLAMLAAQGVRLYREALEQQSLSDRVAQLRAEPDYTTIDQLPQDYLEAVVAVEDHRFAQHHGIDWIAVGRAVWHNVQAGSLKEGGSTITQQLAKNLYFTQEKRLVRKIAEALMAFRLERSYTKAEILELYVNTIYFGNGWYGVHQASLGYYGKEPSELTREEAAMLAGLPNAPSVYAQNSALAAERQQYVLRQMERYAA